MELVKLSEYQDQKNYWEEWRQAGYAAIDQMVDELKDKSSGKDLEQLSIEIREKGKEVTGAVLGSVLKTIGKEELCTQSHPCPSCGRSLAARDSSERTIDTLHGNIRVTRPYFYCSPCRQGFFPFDEKVGLAPTRKQYDLQRAAAKLIAEVPYETAERLFKDLTGNDISNHTLHNLAHDVGQASELMTVLPSQNMVQAAIERNTPVGSWRPIIVVSADGAFLPTRPDTGTRNKKRGPGEWREAKGFRIYLVGQDRIEQIMSWHEIATEEEFGEALQFASTLIPKKGVRIALVGDGAPWIWKHLTKAFPKGKEILDYYHCSEHIHEFADIQYETEDQKQLWIEATMARLNAGEVQSVIWGLQRINFRNKTAQQEAEKLIGYLERNSHRIDYKKFKRGQYPRGSGGIESANKFICQVRMKRSGAWWYVINGNAMLRLRCSVYNGTFDEVFSRYKRIHKTLKNS